jgi:hypothetical protein
VTVVACAVGRLDPAGGWIGFAPTLEDDYALVVGTDDSSTALAPAESDELIALAIAYFADELPEPPEALAATHGDVAALVRHVAVGEAEFERARLLEEAVDAIDDGLAADVVVGRLGRCLSSDEEPETRLRRRAAELLGERPHHRE